MKLIFGIIIAFVGCVAFGQQQTELGSFRKNSGGKIQQYFIEENQDSLVIYQKEFDYTDIKKEWRKAVAWSDLNLNDITKEYDSDVFSKGFMTYIIPTKNNAKTVMAKSYDHDLDFNSNHKIDRIMLRYKLDDEEIKKKVMGLVEMHK